MNQLFFINKSIHRKLLEKQLKLQTEKIRGTVLDIGSKDARYMDLFSAKVVAIDAVENLAKNVKKGNIYSLNFPGNSFDAVLATEVFQYLDDPDKALTQIRKVLKPGGILLLSTPMVYRVHDDLIRYTKQYWTSLLKDFTKTKFIYLGNFYTVILDTIRYKITRLPNRALRYFAYLMFLPFVLLIPLSVKFLKDTDFVSGYLIVVKK